MIPRFLLLSFLFLPYFYSYSQKTDSIFNECISISDTIDGQKVFAYAELMPEYPGEIDSMKKFIFQNLKYQQEREDWYGKIYITFVVDSIGNIRNPCILKRQNKEYITPIEQEALRVINLMPKWMPGKQNGKPKAVRYCLPIKFGF